MIRDDADPAPSGAQQAADTIEEGIDLGIYLANKQSIERMAQGVELAGLGPAAAFAADGHLGLIADRESRRPRAPSRREAERPSPAGCST